MSYENIDPYEWEESKKESGRRQVIRLEREAVQIEVAQNMLAENEPSDKIVKYTGLTIEQIEKLKVEKLHNRP